MSRPLGLMLEDFDKAEEEAFSALFARVGELEVRRGQEGERTKDALQRQLEGIRRRLKGAAEDYAHRSEAFHKQLLEGSASPEEFRARLVMLEMEYSSRLRIAEEGLHLIGTRLGEHAEDNEGWFRGLLGEVRQVLRARLRPVREELEQALREREKSLEEQRAALAALREEPPAAPAAPPAPPDPAPAPDAAPSPATELLLPAPDPGVPPEAAPATEVRLPAPDPALSGSAAPPGDGQDQVSRTQALAAEAEHLRAELLHLRKGLEEQLTKVITGLCTERESLRKKLLDLQRELDAKSTAATKAEEDLAGCRRTIMDLRRELKELDEERHEVRRGSADSQREIHRLVEERNRLRQRVQEVRSGHNAIRQSVAEMAGALKKLLAERAFLTERLGNAERDLKAALAAREPGAPPLPSAGDPELEAEAARLRADGEGLKAELEGLEARLKTAEAERDRAKAGAALAAKELERTKAASKAVQRRLLDADVTRDRSIAETQAQWALQKEAFEDALAQKESELTMLRNSLEASERQWEETLTRQDASRMQEIFKLRSDIEALQWKLQEQRRGPA